MLKTEFQIILISSIILFSISGGINQVDAAKTGSYNFCTQFPAFPECSGWRIDAIDDNYWFCEYVNLKELCKNEPDPKKEIAIKDHTQCCQYIGTKTVIKKTTVEENLQTQDIEKIKNNPHSILPLIIWTDKDHYSFGDKTIVYGKFDFTNPSIIENIRGSEFIQTGEVSRETFTVDVKLNGNLILQGIPVSSSGWFSGFFYHNNIYKYSTQNNLLEVEYTVTQGPLLFGGPKTHATYQFTTGDISKEEEGFDIWVDEDQTPTTVRFGAIVENSERFIKHTQHDLVKTRVITPEGYVIPIDPKYSIKDTSSEFSDFSGYGFGTYGIQITYGDNVSKELFEYNSP